MEKEAIKVWKPNMEQVSDVYKNIFNLMIEYSNQLIGEGNKTIQKLNIKDLRNFWEMIRTEM
ncbi:MAG: hypothetical protein LBG52_01760 [Candidatus Peribacteria bacterium]|jgi:hypothetical protein|nr:hypothetical protein [Candidatus Peribacteria bacterium]